jgi:hypothetical protein
MPESELFKLKYLRRDLGGKSDVLRIALRFLSLSPSNKLNSLAASKQLNDSEVSSLRNLIRRVIKLSRVVPSMRSKPVAYLQRPQTDVSSYSRTLQASVTGPGGSSLTRPGPYVPKDF